MRGVSAKEKTKATEKVAWHGVDLQMVSYFGWADESKVSNESDLRVYSPSMV